MKMTPKNSAIQLRNHHGPKGWNSSRGSSIATESTAPGFGRYPEGLPISLFHQRFWWMGRYQRATR